MKKTIKIILIFMILLFTFFIGKTLAADDDLTYTVKVSAPEDGIYGVGQEVTIKFEFSKKIKGQMPKYAIYFGKSDSEKIELETENLEDFSNEVLYKYTIKSGDNGEMKPDGFVNPSDLSYQMTDEDENTYLLTSPFIIKFDKKILADTTIQWTDFTNANVSIDAEDGNRNSFDIKFDNCTLNSDNLYYVHLSHDAEENIVFKDSDDIYNNSYSNGTKAWQASLNPVNNKINNYKLSNFFAEAGDVYITVCEIDRNTDIPKIVLKSRKIERLESLPLTQRLTAYFFDEYTSTFCWETHGENERKLNYKIGKVTDLELLKSLKNGKSSAFEELLKYAKEADSMATGSIKLGEDESITDNLDLVNREYYYVYLELDTENGKYYEIEDVSLYQALILKDTGEKNLYSIVDKEFTWDLSDEEPPKDDDTTQEDDDDTISKNKLPNTGRNLAIAISTVALVTASAVVYKKYNSYKDIK